jgi:hypothetical protein
MDMDAPMKLAILQKEITQDVFTKNIEVPLELTESEKNQFSNEWWTYQERNANLVKYKCQTFSLFQGQCTQLLHEKIKQDPDWIKFSTSYDPLTLYRLIERTVLAQTNDLGFYSFKQESLSNPQWYEHFNTKVDVGDTIGVTH